MARKISTVYFTGLGGEGSGDQFIGWESRNLCDMNIGTWSPDLGTMDRSQCQRHFRTWSIHCPRYPGGILAPSCDWTKNNKDNDARNNDERLEQRNWAPRGGSGAGPWYNARWIRSFGANIITAFPGHRTLDWWQSPDTHSNTFILYIRRRIKDKHRHHFSFFWPLVMWAGAGAFPQLPLRRPSILDNAICCYRCWSGVLTGG